MTGLHPLGMELSPLGALGQVGQEEGRQPGPEPLICTCFFPLGLFPG